MTIFFYIFCYILIGLSISKATEFKHGGRIITVIIWPIAFCCMMLCLLFFPGSTMTDIKDYCFASEEKTKPIKIDKKEILVANVRVKNRFELLDLD